MTSLVQSKSKAKSVAAIPSQTPKGTPSVAFSQSAVFTPAIEKDTPCATPLTQKGVGKNSTKLNTANLILQTPQQVTETAQDEGEFFHEIDKIQAFGVNAADITKLKSAGYCTVLSVIQATKKELCAIKGISEAKVEKVLEAAAKIEVANTFMTGNQLMQRRTQVLRLTSGSSQLDKLLGGGFESMSITEIFGENRTGKTQICHTLCVTSQLPIEIGGGNGKVCFIDTEGTFRPEKINKIAERFGLAGEAVLENIIYARAYTHEHLNQLICMAAGKMGRGELSERQQVLNKTLSKLMKIAEQFNIAILYTNHVMSDPSGGLTFVANPSKPIGGHVLGHASTTRLSLRKGKGEQRVCKIYDSPYLAESECVFQVSDVGVIDATD